MTVYRLTTTHTFTATDAEDKRFPTPRDAWEFARDDYAMSDHGESPRSVRVNLSILDTAAHGTAGCVRLTTGEVVTVEDWTTHYHTGRNLAGYMPEAEVTCHGPDWQAAADAIASDMREYADRDDDAAWDHLTTMPGQDDYPLNADGSREYGDDAPSMSATVGAILTDDGPREPGDWLAYVDDNDGRSLAFWIAVVPDADCDGGESA